MMVIVLFPRTSWFRIASYFFFAGAFCSYHLERNIPSLWSVGRRAGSLRVGPRGRNPCHRYSQHAQKLMQDWFPAGLLCVKFKPNLFIFRRGNSSPSAVGSSSVCTLVLGTRLLSKQCFWLMPSPKIFLHFDRFRILFYQARWSADDPVDRSVDLYACTSRWRAFPVSNPVLWSPDPCDLLILWIIQRNGVSGCSGFPLDWVFPFWPRRV